METTFRWRNWLSVSVFVFLSFGVIKVGLAIVVPATLHLSGLFPGVVFGAGDAQLLGRLFAGRRLKPPASWLRYTIGDHGHVPSEQWNAYAALGVASSERHSIRFRL